MAYVEFKGWHAAQKTKGTTENLNAREAIDTGAQETADIIAKLDEQLKQGLGFYEADQETQNMINQSLNQYAEGGAQAYNESLRIAGVGDNAYSADQLREKYLNRPDIQAQMQQGTQAIERSASARGSLGSGSLLKELQNFGQNTAFQAISQKQSELFNLAQLGSNAAAQMSNSSTQRSQAQSSFLGNIAGQQAQIGNQSSLARQALLSDSKKQTNTRTWSGISTIGASGF